MKITTLIAMFFLPLCSIAAQQQHSGLGGVAVTLMDPVSVIQDFVINGSLVAGVCFIFGAFIRYLRYRKNPFESPFSSVMTLLIIGLLLMVLPLSHNLL